MAATQVNTLIKTVTKRAWHDIEPKVLTFLTTGLTAGVVVEAGDYVGIHISPALAVVISTIVAAIAGYAKSSTNTLEVPATAPVEPDPAVDQAVEAPQPADTTANV